MLHALEAPGCEGSPRIGRSIRGSPTLATIRAIAGCSGELESMSESTRWGPGLPGADRGMQRQRDIAAQLDRMTRVGEDLHVRVASLVVSLVPRVNAGRKSAAHRVASITAQYRQTQSHLGEKPQ